MSKYNRKCRRNFRKVYKRKLKRHFDILNKNFDRPGPNDPIEGPGRAERRRAIRLDRKEQAVSEMERLMNIRPLEAGEILPGLITRWMRVNQVRSARDRRSASRVQLV